MKSANHNNVFPQIKLWYIHQTIETLTFPSVKSQDMMVERSEFSTIDILGKNGQKSPSVTIDELAWRVGKKIR